MASRASQAFRAVHIVRYESTGIFSTIAFCALICCAGGQCAEGLRTNHPQQASEPKALKLKRKEPHAAVTARAKQPFRKSLSK